MYTIDRETYIQHINLYPITWEIVCYYYNSRVKDNRYSLEVDEFRVLFENWIKSFSDPDRLMAAIRIGVRFHLDNEFRVYSYKVGEDIKYF